MNFKNADIFLGQLNKIKSSGTVWSSTVVTGHMYLLST